jgi:hypothetical protein
MTIRAEYLVTTALACVVLGCGGGDGGGDATDDVRTTVRHATPPAVCGALRATVTGVVQAAEALELSGLARSQTQPGVLWSHNDSGDRGRVFALRPSGKVLADLDVPGAAATDWEDIAIRGDELYLGDIGDNARERPSIDVYRVSEPRVPATGTTPPATRLRLRYPDGAHDAETLLVDPRSTAIAVVTKEISGRSGVYLARRPSAATTTTLRRVARLELGIGALATAGDVSANGRVIAIRTYGSVFAWRRAPGVSLGAALRGRPCVSPTPLREGQGEAIALTRDGRGFFTVPEGAHATIRRYTPVRHSR